MENVYKQSPTKRKIKKAVFKKKGVTYIASIFVGENWKIRDLFIDFYVKDFDIIKKFYSTNMFYSKKCDSFFQKMKKQIEAEFGNILLIINNPSTYNTNMKKGFKKSPINFNLTIYLDIQEYDNTFFKKQKDRILELCDYIEKKIKNELKKLPDAVEC